jgi:hypothetical protein
MHEYYFKKWSSLLPSSPFIWRRPFAILTLTPPDAACW